MSRMNDESELVERASRVRLIALDVDGVLTDGTFLWDLSGNEYKRFSFADVMGISLAKQAGLHLAIISGEDNVIIDRLADKLGIRDVYKGAKDKLCCVKDLLRRHGLSLEQVCYVGDDVNDIPVLQMVGLPVAVANSLPRVRPHACWITERRGGNGAVREVIDGVLSSQLCPDQSR